MKTACLILAAGEGKRMHTRLPKVLHDVCGEPMIFYPVSVAIKRGWSPIVVVTGKSQELVRGYLSGRFGERVGYALQDPPAGTAHAVLSAQRVFRNYRGKLAILYGDVPLLTSRDLGALQRAGRDAPVVFLTCRLRDPSGYGRVIRDQCGQVEKIVEQLDATPAELQVDEINTGIYLVDAPYVFSALRGLRQTNAQAEFYLTDLVRLARRGGLKVVGMLRKSAQELLGINDRRELAKAQALLNRRLVDGLMRSGVTVMDPQSTYLGPEVRVGADTIIFPGCVIHGRVRIGERCRIGPGAVIRNSRIDSGAEVRAYSMLEECRVGTNAWVGPFGRLRPGARLDADSRVGNFVEVKQTRIGRGSKANHLTYLGDTIIGTGVNVGAGTITCNYDGVHKHRTVVEDGVFIGSDTQLVAPVRVGKGAVIGAGTTVTDNVPPDSLAVSRVKQKNIPGYARRKRRR